MVNIYLLALLDHWSNSCLICFVTGGGLLKTIRGHRGYAGVMQGVQSLQLV